MRINSEATSGIGSVRPKGDALPHNSSFKDSGVAEMNDVFSVSPTAQLAAEIRGKLAKIPNERTSRLEAIQNQIKSNTYHPDSEVIVDRLLREHTQQIRY